MKKAFSVFVQNLAYYNEGIIVGGWIDLPQPQEKINEFLKDVVKIDNTHEEYEIADIENYPFEYKGIQWSSLSKINSLAVAYSKLEESEKEAVEAYCNYVENNNLGVNELINICFQANEIPYYNYNFSNMNNYINISNYEKMGLTMAYENGLSAKLEKLGVNEYFDYEGYGRAFSYDYKLLENGYMEYENIDKTLYANEEIEEKINEILLENNNTNYEYDELDYEI